MRGTSSAAPSLAADPQASSAVTTARAAIPTTDTKAPTGRQFKRNTGHHAARASVSANQAANVCENRASAPLHISAPAAPTSTYSSVHTTENTQPGGCSLLLRASSAVHGSPCFCLPYIADTISGAPRPSTSGAAEIIESTKRMASIFLQHFLC